VKSPISFLKECARVGKIGCKVEIRSPHPFSDMAMTEGHISVFSLQGVRNMEYHFPHIVWDDGDRRPKFLSHIIQASERLQEAKKELPFLNGLSDDIIMKYIPGTSHDGIFYYEIVQNEFKK
jgi:hypothetical protein